MPRARRGSRRKIFLSFAVQGAKKRLIVSVGEQETLKIQLHLSERLGRLTY
jgi:hypothetical protein